MKYLLTPAVLSPDQTKYQDFALGESPEGRIPACRKGSVGDRFSMAADVTISHQPSKIGIPAASEGIVEGDFKRIPFWGSWGYRSSHFPHSRSPGFQSPCGDENTTG